MIENRNRLLRASFDPRDAYGRQTRGWSYQAVVAFSGEGDALVLDAEAGKLVPANGREAFRGLVEDTGETWAEAGV
ncbi:hypothetical protein CFK38_06230 [Brachybacterium vulturis]|uniref:Uncharacterized protein n=1 Tax=Brachybacterium vulturis TaxID=2017484 RepID=A0A291GMA2_9MICO|nr:hypothetical protein [Brachybacterium vulturis]ATG51166.1 hypothetical protein CFK38_06230 [Brachybacterium vulturis]